MITGDINEFDLGEEDKGSFDRVMSIEMFEHMKNYKLLIAKISGWLCPGGKLFGELSVGHTIAVGKSLGRVLSYLAFCHGRRRGPAREIEEDAVNRK